MPQNHRGQEVGDNHFNKVQWQRTQSNGDTYGTATPHGKSETWETEVSDYGSEGYGMQVTKPHLMCEDGSCMDTVGYGTYRTEGRAKTAAESLVKRAAEGRDMQTGRSGYKTRGSYEQPGREDY